MQNKFISQCLCVIPVLFHLFFPNKKKKQYRVLRLHLKVWNRMSTFERTRLEQIWQGGADRLWALKWGWSLIGPKRGKGSLSVSFRVYSAKGRGFPRQSCWRRTEGKLISIRLGRVLADVELREMLIAIEFWESPACCRIERCRLPLGLTEPNYCRTGGNRLQPRPCLN